MKDHIEQLRGAWEAAKAADPASENTQRATMALILAIMSGAMSGDVTHAEAEPTLKAIGDWAASQLPPGIAELVDHLTGAGLPPDLVREIARKVMTDPNTEPFRVIHVDSDGVASVVELTPDHPADGIGRPIGNA